MVSRAEGEHREWWQVKLKTRGPWEPRWLAEMELQKPAEPGPVAEWSCRGKVATGLASCRFETGPLTGPAVKVAEHPAVMTNSRAEASRVVRYGRAATRRQLPLQWR